MKPNSYDDPIFEKKKLGILKYLGIQKDKLAFFQKSDLCRQFKRVAKNEQLFVRHEAANIVDFSHFYFHFCKG